MEELAGSSPFEARQSRLQAQLEARRLSVLLVTKPENLFYLTNFRGDAGVLAMGPRPAVLWVDPRYTLQARGSAFGVEVREEKRRLLDNVGRWLARRSKGRSPYRVGYEDGHLTCAAFQELRQTGLNLRAASGIIEEMRAVKDGGEIDRIRRAGHLTAAVFEDVRPLIRPGVRENEIAAEIEYRMRKGGADGPAFETIVASGPRAALPHARASSKPLENKEFVILDFGAILAGYAADMTRTIYLGEPSRRILNLYRAVRAAQEKVIEALRPRVAAGDVDAIARRTLARARLGRYFTHSTGHGVGLEIHEAPRLGRGNQTLLESGSVVTAEPGVYLEGIGGVRIEDTVLVRDGTAEILTPASKDDWVIA